MSAGQQQGGAAAAGGAPAAKRHKPAPLAGVLLFVPKKVGRGFPYLSHRLCGAAACRRLFASFQTRCASAGLAALRHCAQVVAGERAGARWRHHSRPCLRRHQPRPGAAAGGRLGQPAALPAPGQPNRAARAGLRDAAVGQRQPAQAAAAGRGRAPAGGGGGRARGGAGAPARAAALCIRGVAGAAVAPRVRRHGVCRAHAAGVCACVCVTRLPGSGPRLSPPASHSAVPTGRLR